MQDLHLVKEESANFALLLLTKVQNLHYTIVGGENMGELKELRIEKSVTQLELAKLVNMSKMAISHWEKGHSEPSISQLIILSDFFGVSVDYLIGKTDYI